MTVISPKLLSLCYRTTPATPGKSSKIIKPSSSAALHDALRANLGLGRVGRQFCRHCGPLWTGVWAALQMTPRLLTDVMPVHACEATTSQ